jgi:hypothetical protein
MAKEQDKTISQASALHRSLETGGSDSSEMR